MIPIRYNLRSLAVRRASSVMTALAVGLTVMVLLLLSGFVDGIKSTINNSAATGTYLVIQKGMNDEGGFIPRKQLDDIRSRPEISADGNSAPRISPEFIRGFNPTTTEQHRQFGLVRGVYFPEALRVHRSMRLVSGR